MTKNDRKGKIRMIKARIVAIILCLVTLITVMPIGAVAADDIRLQGYTIGITDGIYLRYHIQMSESSYNGGGYIRFTKSNGEITEIAISDGEKDTESGYYVYSCEVAAAEMTERITAILYSETGSIVKGFGRYSVREYAEEILNGSEYIFEAKEAVKAMLNYGAYAQIYFGNVEIGLANEGIEDNVQSFDKAVDGYFINNANVGGLKYVSTALELGSKTVMYHYFRLDGGKDISGFSFKFNGKDVAPTISEKNGVVRYCFKSEGIAAFNISKGIGFVVYDANAKFIGSLTYSPVHYLYLVISTVKDNPELLNLAKAMYLYSEAVEAYYFA